MDNLQQWLLVLGLTGSVLMLAVQGAILCECTTEECLGEGKRSCYAAHYCYSEYFKDTLTRGCIDEGSSLLCENRKPKGIDNWPSLFCCNDRALCNKDVTPTLPAHLDEQRIKPQDRHIPPAGNPQDPGEDDSHQPVRCQNAAGTEDGAAQRSNNSGGSGKVINPIYIAVPVAGVCVLLALVIFAMYLLRRRSHHYDNYHHYHDHLPHAPPHGHKQGGGMGAGSGGGGGNGGGGMPMYHHHHHCDCICQKSLPPCGGKVNRCTDSERSSSGSETKLFLQA